MMYKEAINYCKNKLYRLPKAEELKNEGIFWIEAKIIEIPNGKISAYIGQTNKGDTNINHKHTVLLLSTIPDKVLSIGKIYNLKQQSSYVFKQYYKKNQLKNDLKDIQAIMTDQDRVLFI